MVLRFGISQVHGGSTVTEGARAFAHALETLVGKPVRLHVVKDYASLLSTLRLGGIELAWMPPFLHIEAARTGAMLAAVVERDGALTYRSALVVRADDPIRALDELRGARAAWTDRSSASGFVFPRLHLLGAGLNLREALAEETFLGAPREVCGAVADGRADIGACFTSEAHAGDLAQTLVDVGRIYPAATWRLRVLAVTAAIPSDGIVLAPTVAPIDRARIVDALLRLSSLPEGAEGVKKLLFGERLVGVTDGVARAIERLAPLLRQHGDWRSSSISTVPA